MAGLFGGCTGTWFAGSGCANDNLRGTVCQRRLRWGRLGVQSSLSRIMPTIVTKKSRILPGMVTRIVSNSGKRNGKPFRINLGADNFYGFLQFGRSLTAMAGCMIFGTGSRKWNSGLEIKDGP